MPITRTEDSTDPVIGMNVVKPATVLIVDDELLIRDLIERLLSLEGYMTRTASNGIDALKLVAKDPPDLILLDVEMREMNGFQVADRLKSDPATRHIPIIMVTGLDAHESRMRGLTAGVEEFLGKPVDRTELVIRVRNLLRLKGYGDTLTSQKRVLEDHIRLRTGQLRDNCIQTILTLARAVEYRDETVGSHIERISHYARLLAEQLRLNGDFVEDIFYAAPMHDIGNIGVPDHILLKRGPLTTDEWTIMKTHTLLGSKLLSVGTSSIPKMAAEIALTHHERWDGTGYPLGLKGEEIPIAGRIVNICDQYDALRSQRPHKPALEHDKAVLVLTKGDDRTMPQHFDPVILDAFCVCEPFLRKIYAAYSE